MASQDTQSGGGARSRTRARASPRRRLRWAASFRSDPSRCTTRVYGCSSPSARWSFRSNEPRCASPGLAPSPRRRSSCRVYMDAWSSRIYLQPVRIVGGEGVIDLARQPLVDLRTRVCVGGGELRIHVGVPDRKQPILLRAEAEGFTGRAAMMGLGLASRFKDEKLSLERGPVLVKEEETATAQRDVPEAGAQGVKCTRGTSSRQGSERRGSKSGSEDEGRSGSARAGARCSVASLRHYACPCPCACPTMIQHPVHEVSALHSCVPPPPRRPTYC